MRAKTVLIIIFSVCGIVVLIAAAALLLYKFNAKNRILDGPDMVREDTFDFSSGWSITGAADPSETRSLWS